MSWHRPRGSLAAGSDSVRLAPESAGWDYSGLRVASVGSESALEVHTPQEEVVVVPLTGSFTVDAGGDSYVLEGRPSVFGPLTDRLYLPPDVPFTVTASVAGEVAIATARADVGGRVRYLAADETSVELRGAGQASRQINGVFPAEVEGPQRIIVVEVLTPSGNWSSFPPHKHDEWADGEVPLEEIYYFRIAGERGFGFHRTYTADGEIDETVTVGDGDVFLIPRGYHGPCVAAPGYDMYYLNVMAGPERAWLICTDPDHEWLLEAWSTMDVDPRLPMNKEDAT